MDNKSAFVQEMDCHEAGDKLLPESVINQFTEAYMTRGFFLLTEINFNPSMDKWSHAQ